MIARNAHRFYWCFQIPWTLDVPVRVSASKVAVELFMRSLAERLGYRQDCRKIVEHEDFSGPEISEYLIVELAEYEYWQLHGLIRERSRVNRTARGEAE